MFHTLSSKNKIDLLIQNVLKKVSLVDVHDGEIVEQNQLLYIERMLEQIHILMLVGRKLNIRELVVRMYMVNIDIIQFK